MIARDSCAPRQASGEAPGSSLTSSASSDPLRIGLRDSYGMLGVQVVAARRRPASGPRAARAPPTPSNAVERGTTRSASATASGWRWRSIRWRIASTISPRNARLDRRIAVGAHEAVDAVALESVGERVPARQLAAGRVCGRPRCAGRDLDQRRDPLRDARARRRASSRRPSTRPTSTARSSPRASSTASRSRDQVRVLVGAAGRAPGSESPCPRAS